MKLHLIRDAVRAKEIVTVLLRYRFDELLDHSDTPASWIAHIVPAVQADLPLARRIRLAIEELGPTFIKIGQVLSTRPDLLPNELIEELSSLRANVTPLTFADIQPLIEQELHQPFEACFAHFSEIPSATGSLGQIYRARLRDTNKEVAVKIQKPHLRQRIETDFEIIGWLVAQAHLNIPQLRAYALPEVIEELKKGLLSELDFRVEARHAATFDALNQFPNRVFAPQVLSKYTTPRLLITEWINGNPPHLLLGDPQRGKDIATLGGQSFFSQIVENGFFHGDPHPGNVLITEDSRICLLDWGLVGMLTQSMRYAMVDLFSACSERDARQLTRIALRMGHPPNRFKVAQLEKSVTEILFKYNRNLLKMESLGSIIVELVYVFGSHGIQIARDYTLLAKAILSIEETAKQIDPEFNLAAVSKPYILKLQRERWNPHSLSKEALAELQEQAHHASQLPKDLKRILHLVEDKQLNVKLNHMEIGRASNTIHHAFSRLSLAVIIGSLIIGSSIVINTGIQPFLWGYPAIGIVGYLLSATIGSYVAFDILRSAHPRK